MLSFWQCKAVPPSLMTFFIFSNGIDNPSQVAEKDLMGKIKKGRTTSRSKSRQPPFPFFLLLQSSFLFFAFPRSLSGIFLPAPLQHLPHQQSQVPKKWQQLPNIAFNALRNATRQFPRMQWCTDLLWSAEKYKSTKFNPINSTVPLRLW